MKPTPDPTRGEGSKSLPQPLFVPPDLQSGGMEYKDLQSDNDNGIANADTQGDGRAYPSPPKGREPTPAHLKPIYSGG